MKLTIFVDQIPHQIDTADPELLAKWIMEIFGRMSDWNPATLVEMSAQPSWLLNDRGEYSADWATDGRIISQVMRLKTPRDLLTELGKQLDEYDAFKEQS